MQEHITRDYQHAHKRYIEVLARFSSVGDIRPIALCLKNRLWEIDQIYHVKRRASQRAGGSGLCYECRIGEQRFCLFLEETRWFLEL